MTSTIRLRFWLLMMEAARVLFGFGSRPYLYCVGKAGDATDWGVVCDQSVNTETPW